MVGVWLEMTQIKEATCKTMSKIYWPTNFLLAIDKKSAAIQYSTIVEVLPTGLSKSVQYGHCIKPLQTEGKMTNNNNR